MNYDPFVSKTISANQTTVNSYWHSTTNNIATAPLNGDKSVSVVVIGSGYTGLSCALELAQSGIKDIHILEANTIGWGCSSRNAGFVLPGSGRLSYKQMVDRFGSSSAIELHEQYIQAIDLLNTRVSKSGVDVDATEVGYLKLAHSKAWFDKLQKTAGYLQENFDYKVETIERDQFSQRFVKHKHAYGAIRYTNGFGINPLKLVNSYANACLDLGVSIYSNSPAIAIRQDKTGRHIIETPNGIITADKLVVASNGYTPAGLNTPLRGKILPVLTSVIVTRPLTNSEIKESGFQSQQVMMDTRELKYYYRLLPDNRILFGGRSAISGREAKNPIYQERLLKELRASFCGLEKVTMDFNWNGWISVAYDQMPHIFRTPNDIFYATGYCGSGVSFSAWAGKQLADMILERKVSSPLLTELPTFPFAPFRRIGQRFFYQYGRFKDWIQ